MRRDFLKMLGYSSKQAVYDHLLQFSTARELGRWQGETPINEEWHVIEDIYNGKYEVSNYARIRNAETKKIMKQHINNRNVVCLTLMVNSKKRKNLMVKKIVAKVFGILPDTIDFFKFDSDHYIYPKDKNPFNCNPDNLYLNDKYHGKLLWD